MKYELDQERLGEYLLTPDGQSSLFSGELAGNADRCFGVDIEEGRENFATELGQRY